MRDGQTQYGVGGCARSALPAAIAAWQAFGTYAASISETIQLQDIGAYRANLEHYKEIAMQYTALLGIDIFTFEISPPVSIL